MREMRVSDGKEIATMALEREELAYEVARLADRGSRLMTYLAAPVDGRMGCHVLLASEDGLVHLSSEGERFATLSRSYAMAGRYERLMGEKGLRFEGARDARPLVDWEDRPPDHRWEPPREGYRFNRVEGEGMFEIPVGPIHAGVIEPGHFRFSVAGEQIVRLETRFGYAHKGTEALSAALPYRKGVILAERISGDNGLAHSVAYAQAVESLAGTEVPERGRYLRTMFLELERLYNLLGDVSGIALDTGFAVPASLGQVLRERVLRLNESVCGSRLLRSVNTIGGVRADLDRDAVGHILATLLRLKLDLDDLEEVLDASPTFLDRVEGTGQVSNEEARRLGLLGPVARASGVPVDVRRDRPYAAYGDLDFEVSVRNEGDVNARLRVKLEEAHGSISLIEQVLDLLPGGRTCFPTGKVDGDGIGIGMVETPRGEAVHWILGGDGGPLHHHIRDPSFHNWPAMEIAVLGDIVPDFPLVNKSMNLSYSGNDL